MDFNVVRSLKKTVEDLSESKYSAWSEKTVFAYIESLKEEYDNILESKVKLTYLITKFTENAQDSDDKKENVELLSEDDICYLVKSKKYKWTEYFEEDFEYIKQVESKIQTAIPKSMDIKKAKKQIDVLEKVLMDIVATLYVFRQYAIDLIQYQL